MEIPKPIIKLNGGNPVAICNRCFCMMCYVSCNKDRNECIIIDKKFGPDGNPYSSTPIGQAPPSYCDDCHDLLLNFSLNE